MAMAMAILVAATPMTRALEATRIKALAAIRAAQGAPRIKVPEAKV
jgi:hypothetical protein